MNFKATDTDDKLVFAYQEQQNWILKYESNNNEISGLYSENIWQAVIEYNLNKNFVKLDKKIYGCLIKNFQNITERIPDSQLKDSVRTALVSFPRMYWLLRKSNLAYQEAIKLAPREKASKIIDIYSGLANGAFIESLRILQALEQNCSDKVLKQTTLRPLKDMLSSKRLVRDNRDYRDYVNLISSNIRNATDHGGVEIKSNEYSITYTDDNHENVTIGKSFSQTENEVKSALQGLSAFIRAVLELSVKVGVDFLKIDEGFPESVKSAWHRLQLSTLNIACKLIEIRPITENRTQLTIELDGINADGNDKVMFCIQTAIYATNLVIPRSQHFDRVFITYSCPNALDSCIAVDSDEILRYLDNQISSADLLRAVEEEGLMTWETVEDDMPIQDIQYHDIEKTDYKITNISNPNTESSIRFVANVELSRATRPNHVKRVVPKIIHDLRNLPSGGNEKLLTKHGLQPADVVFIMIYKNLDGKIGIFEQNDNLIATVQFDINREFLINFDNSALFAFRKMRREGDIEYGWNPNFGKN